MRLQHYIEHNQYFPNDEEILPHLQAEVKDRQLSLQALDEDVALGLRESFIYRERFNLGHAMEVLEEPPPATTRSDGFAFAWRNYIKSVFKKEYMYRLSCNPDQILYVAENKTLPGREDRTYEGEAMGRKLAVVLFEDMDHGLVRRVHRDTTGMHQILLTIADILLTLGVALPEDHERSAADS